MKTSSNPSFGMAIKASPLAKSVMKDTIQKRKDVQTLNRIITQQANNPIDIYITKNQNKTFSIKAEVGHKTFEEGLLKNRTSLAIIKKAAKFANKLHNEQLDANANQKGGFAIINKLADFTNNNK